MSVQYLTVRQAAERIGVHVETIRRWIRDGEIEAEMVRRGCPGYRIEVSEVERVARKTEPEKKAS